jgi:rhodanese-related sulfurtransferase
VAQRLREQGFGEAYGLRGGFEEWLRAGGPTEEKDRC